MIQYEKFTLSNGLKVIHHPDITTPMVAMSILYDVGAKDEDEKQKEYRKTEEREKEKGGFKV